MPLLSKQHTPVPQSSLPSHVASKPLHVTASAVHDGPLTKSAQHFCVLVHAVAPHKTPFAPGGASGMFEPLPFPSHRPFTHICPLGHACMLSHLKCVPL